jgi:hypothetical protein
VGESNPLEAAAAAPKVASGCWPTSGRHTTIKSVRSGESGSSEAGSLGKPPTAEHYAESIDLRITSNKGVVQDYIPVGIFVLPTILVRAVEDVCGSPTLGEIQIDLNAGIRPFPEQRIFDGNATTFLELDRSDGRWKSVSCGEIIPA